MNRVTWFQISLLRQVLTVFVVGFMFFAAPVFNSNMLVANAETVISPEGVYYKGTPDESINEGYFNKRGENKSVFDASEATKGQKVEKSQKGEKSQNSSGVGTVTTPEGIYYKGTPDDSVHNRINEQVNNNKSVFDASEATKNNPQNRVEEKSENPFQEAIETVREKLNLDEDLPRSTKEFLKETEEAVEETVEPITGTRKGYYQIP